MKPTNNYFTLQAFINALERIHIRTNSKKINQGVADAVQEAIAELVKHGLLHYDTQKALWQTPKKPRIVFTGQRILRWFNIDNELMTKIYDRNGVRVFKIVKTVINQDQDMEDDDADDNAPKETRVSGFLVTVRQRCFLIDF